MAYAKSITGITHKFHRGTKYTYCGKKIRFMRIGGRNGKRCDKCWN